MPDAPYPTKQPRQNYFDIRAAVGKDGAIYLATFHSPTLPTVDAANFYRLQGERWQLLEEREFANPVSNAGLAPFADSIAFSHGATELEALRGDAFKAISSPDDALSRVSDEASFDVRDLRVGPDGKDYLLARYVDASQPLSEQAIPASGLAVLRYDEQADAWQIFGSGTSLVEGWIEPNDVSSDLKIIDQAVRA